MLIPFTSQQLTGYCQPRVGETRVGEAIVLPQPELSLADNLAQAKKQGCRFVLLGIPEDIGPRANLGLGGADAGWQAFLGKFLNLQHNAFMPSGQILLLGAIDCTDLQLQSASLNACHAADLVQLCQLCEELDQRVYAVLREIFAAQLLPVVIGGGHNNAFPLLKALSEYNQSAVNCANLDPHSDFRSLEGRHSGNGFSYAHQQQYLARYFVLGLHELKNNATALEQLQQAGAEFCSYQRMFVRQELSYQDALDQCIDFITRTTTDTGIEVDTDSISLMPVSAFTNCGLTVNHAEQFVYQLAKLPRSRYLHLAEAAPAQHPAGLKAGLNEAGQILSTLVYAFIMGKQEPNQSI
ncbi:formimidoylglutamase [Chromatiaceae bacterium AAb-1]|nr:formimidoylglutamase [Chromatiaceae bacterium AAb-1]